MGKTDVIKKTTEEMRENKNEKKLLNSWEEKCGEGQLELVLKWTSEKRGILDVNESNYDLKNRTFPSSTFYTPPLYPPPPPPSYSIYK